MRSRQKFDSPRCFPRSIKVIVKNIISWKGSLENGMTRYLLPWDAQLARQLLSALSHAIKQSKISSAWVNFRYPSLQGAWHFRAVAEQTPLQVWISSLFIAMRFPLVNIMQNVPTARLWSNFLFIIIFLFVGFIVVSELIIERGRPFFSFNPVL